MDKIFFDNWQSLLRTFIITILAYASMIILLRASGKRTLAKMNAYDFVITIAIGSALTTVALNKNVALADGVLAFFLLIFLQFLISWLSIRFKKVKNIVTSQPVLLVYKGEILQPILKKERISLEELYVAARKKGIENLKTIDAVILETTGDLTIVSTITSDKAETLQDVKNYPE